jgi:hypothetical protein
MLALFVGEYRGLFFWCPVLILSIAGLAELLRKERALAVMVTAVTVAILFQVASFFMAFGGNAFGRATWRPALPFIGLAAAYGIKRWPEQDSFCSSCRSC